MRHDDQGDLGGRGRSAAARFRAAQAIGLALTLAGAHGAARSEEAPAGWRKCQAMTGDREQRLACFDDLAARLRDEAQKTSASASSSPSPPKEETAGTKKGGTQQASNDDCLITGPAGLARFWELQKNTSCGTGGIRGYRPISMSVVLGDSVNDQPTSGNPLNSATTSQPYRNVETRVQLSVRTKVFQNLLTSGNDLESPRDSVWFAYSQQSYWQVFTGTLSRPFRSTDHEPEVIYVHPFKQPIAAGWTLRYGGLGLVHQSNGQSLPYSRSWNRGYVMAGAEHDGGFTLQGRVWRRLREDPVSDDNPGISDYIGRAELTAAWNLHDKHSFSLTLRHPLNSNDKGSARIEWLQRLPNPAPSALGNLRLHTQLFTGYGDSLIDFNRRRTVLSVGLSLVDW